MKLILINHPLASIHLSHHTPSFILPFYTQHILRRYTTRKFIPYQPAPQIPISIYLIVKCNAQEPPYLNSHQNRSPRLLRKNQHNHQLHHLPHLSDKVPLLLLISPHLIMIPPSCLDLQRIFLSLCC